MKKILYLLLVLMVVAGVAFGLSQSDYLQGQLRTTSPVADDASVADMDIAVKDGSGIMTFALTSEALLSRTKTAKENAASYEEEAEEIYYNVTHLLTLSESALEQAQTDANTAATNAEDEAADAEDYASQISENYDDEYDEYVLIEEAYEVYVDAYEAAYDKYIAYGTTAAKALEEWNDLQDYYDNNCSSYYESSSNPGSYCCRLSGGGSSCSETVSDTVEALYESDPTAEELYKEILAAKEEVDALEEEKESFYDSTFGPAEEALETTASYKTEAEDYADAAEASAIAAREWSDATAELETREDTHSDAGDYTLDLSIDSDGDGIDDDEDSCPDEDATDYDKDEDGCIDDTDTDGDGLTDYEEIEEYYTDPEDVDSDSDGLTDYAEITTYKTDPNEKDSDDDGYSDYDETQANTDPLDDEDYPETDDEDEDVDVDEDEDYEEYDDEDYQDDEDVNYEDADEYNEDTNDEGENEDEDADDEDTDECSHPFNDVNGHWGEDYICEDYENDFVNGKTYVTYSPNTDVTRAEFAKMALSAAGYYEDDVQNNWKEYFEDVGSGDWFYNWVRIGEYVDIFRIEGAYLNPNVPITRSDAVIWFARLSGETIYGFTDDDIPFSDVDASDPFAYAVLIAYNAKTSDGERVIEGDEDSNTFRPYDYISRAEAAAIIARAYDAWFK